MSMVEAGESEHYKLCLTALQRSSNDTEKLISLLAIAKYLKPEKLSKHELLCLFDHIGVEFLQRLLLIPVTETNPSDISSTSMQSISVNMVHVILKVKPDHLPPPVITKLITQISDVFTTLRLDSEEDQMLFDDIMSCFQCLLEIYPDKTQLARILISSGTIRSLIIRLTSGNHRTAQIYSLLYKAFCDLKLSSLEPESFHTLMIFIANEFKTDQSQRKFDLCCQITNILQQNDTSLNSQSSDCPSTSSSTPLLTLPTDASTWLLLITEGLYDIISSRLDKSRRDSAFYLIVALNKIFPLFTWMVFSPNDTSDERCKNFATIIWRLVCIEIVLELRKEEEPIDGSLLNACFMLFESLVNTICNDPCSPGVNLKLTPSDIVKLYNSLRETILTVIDYIKNVMHDWENIQSNQTTFSIIMGCIRIVCFWTLEDLTGIEDKVIDLVPFMVQLLHDQKSFNLVGHFIITSFYEICVNCDDDDPLKRAILSYDISSNVLKLQSTSPFNDQMDKICEAFRNLK